MKAVLISIQPKWCAKVASGAKPIEIRKNRPKLETPFKCYIYCTKPGTTNTNEILETHGVDGKIRKCNGKVMGEFVCDRLVPIRVFDNGSIPDWNFHSLWDSCLAYEELANYIGYGKEGYGWHISDLVIYDEPKELREFIRPCNKEYDCFLCKKSGYAPDMQIDCFNTLSRPPQSWCYVEEA